ncbi:MAG: UDP-N-acetylmuramoyl-tripeptide--D-alanyl-D-alanine ligase [Gammaproteobacteria bacterium]|nr:UDP-N-acetylmuramoyl-tripeptide--D-alanyl-D-alanine ligase [Gammaproteobacteria bacterium]
MMSLSEVASLLNAELQGGDAKISSTSINTRELSPGQLFIALKGEQFDGHDFLLSACEKQAAGVIISQPVQLPIPTIVVPDTKTALGEIAAYHRKKFSLPIIAVTGSCGKTTTKSMIASILNQMGPTLAPIKSFNNDIGVPLTLLQLTEQHQYAVIEMGANHPHEIAYLSKLTEQDVAVITNVAPAHLAGFGTIEGVAKAKEEIYESLSPQGVAIINADDQFADRFKKLMINNTRLTFGIKNHADVIAKNIVLDEEGRANFEAHYPDGKLSISLPCMGLHNVMNALAAIAATSLVGATPHAIITGLNSMAEVSKRLVKYKGLSGSLIIDDSYNANPVAVVAALEILAHSKGEKIFVFGDMGELGHQEEKFHIEIGEHAKKLGVDQLYAYGKLSQLTANAFGANGCYFNDQQSLINALKPALHSNAVVLIKGSRSSRMENIVQAIIQEI